MECFLGTRRGLPFRSDIRLNSEFEKQISPPQAAEDRDLRAGMTVWWFWG
jgi:hypothetical protein